MSSKIPLWGCSLNVFVIVIVFAFVIVFLLVRSCFLTTLIKCLKGHKSLGPLFKGVLQMSLSLSLSLSLSFCCSSHVSSSLWSHVSRVTSLSECSLVVFSKVSISEWVSQWVSESVSDKGTYRAVRWQLKTNDDYRYNIDNKWIIVSVRLTLSVAT